VDPEGEEGAVDPGGGARPSWVDSHCHLQDDPEPDGALARAQAASVSLVVCAGTDVPSSRRALELASSAGRPWPAASPARGGPRGAAAGPTGAAVAVTAGLHPHYALLRGEAGVEGIARLIDDALAARGLRGELARGGQAGGFGEADAATSTDPAGGPLVAVGECGLDYHYDRSPRADQRAAFAAQVELAWRHRLPIVVHSREAWDDTIAVLEEAGVPPVTIFHCFTGGPHEARRCLDLGAYLSFSGIVTFKGADAVRQSAALCPLDRLLVETDAPLLTPVPYRGRRNEPALVPWVGRGVAAARGQPPEEVAGVTARTARRLFGMPEGGLRPEP
jgi:TatD DNase family protein